MHIVFCADRGVLPGLHVAVYSLLERINPQVSQTRFHIFSDELADKEMTLLSQTLQMLNKPFALERRQIDSARFDGFPKLNNSYAAYYRLVVPQALDVERFLYVDADTLCGVDVSSLQDLDMGNAPAGWVPEAPLAGAVDRAVAGQLGNSPDEPYFNSGVILVNVAEWRRQRITERAVEYIVSQRPRFHDQSALNVVLHKNSVTLDERYNCITNMRKHWPTICLPVGKVDRLLHFVDYPKPWDFLGEFVNPYHRLWHAVLEKTAMKDFRSWHATPARKFPKSRKAWLGYKKAIKDRCLLAGYTRGWLKQIKGVPTA
jgi:lipopolysaccharide biosynthesis glycosyltransferase